MPGSQTDQLKLTLSRGEAGMGGGAVPFNARPGGIMPGETDGPATDAEVSIRALADDVWAEAIGGLPEEIATVVTAARIRSNVWQDTAAKLAEESAGYRRILDLIAAAIGAEGIPFSELPALIRSLVHATGGGPRPSPTSSIGRGFNRENDMSSEEEKKPGEAPSKPPGGTPPKQPGGTPPGSPQQPPSSPKAPPKGEAVFND